jgi:hypothetical protein
MKEVEELDEFLGSEPVTAENVRDLPFSKLISGITASTYGLFGVVQRLLKDEMSNEKEELASIELMKREMELLMEELDIRMEHLNSHTHAPHSKPRFRTH